MHTAGIIQQGLQNVTAITRVVTLATVTIETEMFKRFALEVKALAPGRLCIERGLKSTRKVNALEEADRLYTVRQQEIRNILVLASADHFHGIFGARWYRGCAEMPKGRSDMCLSVSCSPPNNIYTEYTNTFIMIVV